MQSDVDNDLVGDSCDTNQDRYAVREASPELKHAADSWRAVICQARQISFQRDVISKTVLGLISLVSSLPCGSTLTESSPYSHSHRLPLSSCGSDIQAVLWL